MKWEDGNLMLRQSDIGDFLKCPESFRLKRGIDNERFESDAAHVGTCLHALIENETVYGGHPTLKSAKAWAGALYVQNLEEWAADATVTYSTETFGTPRKALDALMVLVESWWFSPERSQVLSTPPEDKIVEQTFKLPFTTVPFPDGDINVWLTGTPDLIWHGSRVWDWKSAGGPYQLWEKQRWAVQPTVYTWAAHQQGLLQPDEDGRFWFDYKVFLRRASSQEAITYSVWRTADHWSWLETQVKQLVSMLALPDGMSWPMNDQHALCSPKWCPFWAGCKGAHLPSGWER